MCGWWLKCLEVVIRRFDVEKSAGVWKANWLIPGSVSD